MAEPDRVYVDTNVFIRVFEGNDDLSALLGSLFLREPTAQRPFLATSELTFAELLVTPCREDDVHLIELYDNWTQSNDFLEVGPVDRAVLWAAAVLRADYTSLKLPDAIHLGTALLMRCSRFLTADRRLGGDYTLAFQHPGLTFGPARVAVVRPDTDVVRSIVDAR